MGGALVGFVDSVDRRARRRGSADRGARLEAQQERRAAAGQLDVRDPAEGRDRAEVPGGRRSGTRGARAPNGATVPLGQTSAAVDLDQVLSMFTPPTRKGVVASTVGFSDGARRARHRRQRRDRRVRPAARGPGAGGAQPRFAAAPTSAGSSAASRRSPERSRRSRRRRRRCSSNLDDDVPGAGERVDAVPPGLRSRRHRRRSAR